jgi:transposase InsO family protein
MFSRRQVEHLDALGQVGRRAPGVATRRVARNINMFWSLAQARVVISDWKADYKHRRRHSALGYQAQLVYAAARTHQ